MIQTWKKWINYFVNYGKKEEFRWDERTCKKILKNYSKSELIKIIFALCKTTENQKGIFDFIKNNYKGDI